MTRCRDTLIFETSENKQTGYVNISGQIISYKRTTECVSFLDFQYSRSVVAPRAEMILEFSKSTFWVEAAKQAERKSIHQPEKGRLNKWLVVLSVG